MSLAGIAISIGVLVDGAIVEVENAYKKLELLGATAGARATSTRCACEALLEVGPSVFFSLLVIAVAFLPIFTLVDQEGRLFKPLAWTKNLTMAIAALLALTLDPALRMLFTRMDFVQLPAALARAGSSTRSRSGRYYPEEKHPISRALFAVYEPACRSVLRHPKTTIAAARPGRRDHASRLPRPRPRVHAAAQRGRDPLHADDAARDLGHRGEPAAAGAGPSCSSRSPRWSACFGKAGRAETSTDPAPFSMMETTVVLKPPLEWRREAALLLGLGARVAEARSCCARVWPDRISYEELVDEMDRALQIPGTTNAWTMPIKNRIDMLTHRHPHAVGHQGLRRRPRARSSGSARGSRALLREVPGTRSVFAERVAGGYFVDFELKRDALARHGLSVAAAQDVVIVRGRRRERHHHDRGPRALPRQRPLPARAARRPRRARARPGDDARRRPDPALAGGRDPRWSAAPP